jgi:DNA-directed RNA polymerase specialized sigma subunit
MDAALHREEALQWVLDKLAAAKKNPSAPSTKGSARFKLETIKVTPPLAPAPVDLKDVRAKELVMWQTWKDSNFHPTHLDPLLDSYKRLINTNVNKFKNKVEVPTAALDFRAKSIVVDALKKWDPSKGASLSTYLTTNLKRLGRFVQEVQNFARLPDNLVRHVGTYNAVKSDLTDRLGHEPDDTMLHEECNKLDPRMTMGHIKRLNKELRKGLLHTGFETKDIFNHDDMTPRHKEVIGLIHHQLNPEEKIVHEYWFGLNGKPSLATSQIAKKQKWDDSKVSKIKKSIFEKMKPYLD